MVLQPIMVRGSYPTKPVRRAEAAPPPPPPSRRAAQAPPKAEGDKGYWKTMTAVNTVGMAVCGLAAAGAVGFLAPGMAVFALLGGLGGFAITNLAKRFGP